MAFINEFQSTPLREGRQMEKMTKEEMLKFQSTPLREGRLLHFCHCLHIGNVSIHAPARGATSGSLTLRKANRFQSTPLREGRHVLSSTLNLECRFQSTPLREGRHYKQQMEVVNQSFNPRPCARGDIQR